MRLSKTFTILYQICPDNSRVLEGRKQLDKFVVLGIIKEADDGQPVLYERLDVKFCLNFRSNHE